jgi:exosortase F-associated protein
MLKIILKNKVRFIVGAVLVLLLILIRTFEDNLFYDPLLDFFKGEFTNNKLPEMNQIKLFLSLGFRYYLNSMISLALLYVIFRDFKIVKFSTLLFIILGSILLIGFVFTLHFFGDENKMILFYIRRFIIQPLFLMLFIPAFYYQKKIKK